MESNTEKFKTESSKIWQARHQELEIPYDQKTYEPTIEALKIGDKHTIFWLKYGEILTTMLPA
jgi:hypothetical protein